MEISLDFCLAPDIMFVIAFEHGVIACHKMRLEPTIQAFKTGESPV
jgi:hypothetical protein